MRASPGSGRRSPAAEAGQAARPGGNLRPAASLPAPAWPEDLADHYDLTISHPAIDQVTFSLFDRMLAQAADTRSLSCALLHDGVVHDAIHRLATGRLTIGFHLDYFALWHVPDDPYARLSQAVQDSGGQPINPPARARLFTNKAATHAELLRRGLGVPETVLLRPWAPDRTLTSEEWRRLRLNEPGARVYVKPANGFGGRGVTRVEGATADGLATAIAAARGQQCHDTLLVQREVGCHWLTGDDGIVRPAYWRVIHCLSEYSTFWWNDHEVEHGRPAYRRVSQTEMRRLRLRPLLTIAKELAELSGLAWFSTELCLSDGPESSRHHLRGSDGKVRPLIVIDYINDQCDVDVQSRWPGAPPDEFVAQIANRFADASALRTYGGVQTLPMRRAA